MNKPDEKKFRTDIQNLKISKVENAILIHEAASYGTFKHNILQIGENLDQLQVKNIYVFPSISNFLKQVLNINLLSTLAITTAFMTVFEGAKIKSVINVTAPTKIDHVIPSFGYIHAGLSAKNLLLNILTSEKPEIRVIF